MHLIVIVGLVNYSHSPELLVTIQVSPIKLKWLLASQWQVAQVKTQETISVE